MILVTTYSIVHTIQYLGDNVIYSQDAMGLFPTKLSSYQLYLFITSN